MARQLPEETFREEKAPPPRRSSFLFRLFALIVLIAACWLGWYAYRQGELPDVTDPAQQQKMLDTAKTDLHQAEGKAVELGHKAADAAKVAADWASRSIEDIRARIQGKPPETKEEVHELVKDSSKEVATVSLGDEPAKKADVASAPVHAKKPWDDSLKNAWDEYYAGVAEHAKSDPSFSTDQVQKALHAAAPHFEQTLNLLDDVKAKGGTSPAVADLEHKTAVRLYDCRKRMALK
jgi:hypothetical protein